MKTVFITTLLVFVFSFVPVIADGHGAGAMMFDQTLSPGDMMLYVEDQALGGADVHEEMEELMEAMMAGELSEANAQKLATYMQEYPGPYGMMMNRLSLLNGHRWLWGGHMSGHGLGFIGWLFPLMMIVWLIVGLAIIAVLIKKLNKK